MHTIFSNHLWARRKTACDAACQDMSVCFLIHGRFFWRYVYAPETSSPAPEHTLAYAGVLMDASVPAID